MIVAVSVSAQNKKPAEPAFTVSLINKKLLISYTPANIRGIDSVTIKLFRTLKGRETLLRQRVAKTGQPFLSIDSSITINGSAYEYRVEVLLDGAVINSEKKSGYYFREDMRPVAGKIMATNSKGTNKIRVSWKIENNITLQQLHLQRSRKKEEGYETITTITGRDTFFVDQVTDANEPYFYRLEMPSLADGRNYYSASVFVIPVFAIIPKVPSRIKAEKVDNVIRLSWISTDPDSRGFYVWKKREGNNKMALASTIIDKNAENQYVWTDSLVTSGESYQYSVMAESNSYDRSADSDTITIAFDNKKIILQAPQELSIITADDTSWHLIWKHTTANENAAGGFMVYHKGPGEREFTPLATGVVPSYLNYYKIPKPMDGDSYQVRAVNGTTQSAFSIPFVYANANESNFGPQHLRAGVVRNELVIRWATDEALPVKEYRLYKWEGNKFVVIATIQRGQSGITTNNYVAGELNRYRLKTILVDNRENNGSHILEIN